MSEEIAAHSPAVPFENAPPYRFQSWLGLIRAGNPQVSRRAILAAAIGWLPLALLTLLHGDFMRPDHANAFILDFGAHARFLIAAPLLILAESLCAPRLAAIARQFITGNLLAEADRPLYERAVQSTRRLLESRLVEWVVFAAAYVLVGALLLGKPVAGVPLWHGSVTASRFAATPAGWWGLLVSLPLLLILLLGWLWRIGLWTRFLWLMSRMQLRLIPSHPDRAGGLMFVGYSLEAFVPLAFTLGVLGAGAVLNQVVHRGTSPENFSPLAAAVTLFAVILFAAPVLVFVRRLIQEHHRGILAYGAFALGVGEQFERKWLARQAVDAETLQSLDFAPTNNLYSITGSAFQMRRIPFEVRSLGLLAGATLLPFVLAALFTLPLDVILRKLVGFFI